MQFLNLYNFFIFLSFFFYYIYLKTFTQVFKLDFAIYAIIVSNLSYSKKNL